jgi:hypothetical protein
VNGGGTIHYSGNPRLSMAIHGGGDVVRDKSFSVEFDHFDSIAAELQAHR